jgi:sulfur carrier protein
MAETVEVFVNGEGHKVPEGISVAELLAQLQLSDKPVAVEVNLELVPRNRHAQTRLSPGDRLEIVTLVGGG